MPRGNDLAVATYNIHRSVGADGVCMPERIAEVLRDLDADIVGLQEVDSQLPEHGVDQLSFLSKALDYMSVAGPTLLSHRGHYGNALLTRWPVRAVRRLDLSVRSHEPRGALDVDLEIRGTVVRVVATHLGLRRAERGRQLKLILDACGKRGRPTLLLGDINEWWPAALHRLNGRFGTIRARATYPARWPLLRLDRIWIDPRAALLDMRVHDTPLARTASDHLPVRARLDTHVLTSASGK